MQAEGDDLVRRIVADIRPPEPWNSAALAPISGDRLRLGPERTAIFGDVADAPQPQRRQTARSKIDGDLKASASERAHIFAHLHSPPTAKPPCSGTSDKYAQPPADP